MATGFPALMIRPPESPLQQYAQIQQIQGNQQEMQARQLQIQAATRAQNDQDALTRTMASWDGKDVGSLPMMVVKNGGSGQAAMSMTQNVLGIKEKASTIAKDDALTNQANTDTAVKQNDEIRGRILNVAGIADPAAKQAAWDAEVTKEEQAGTIKPGQFSHTYPGDSQATALANNFALGSQLVKEAQEREKLALDGWKSAGGQLTNVVDGRTIGGLSNIPVLNNGLQTRYQVLHPGEALPDQFKLAPNASPADFERVDKLLEATEKGTATKAQQDTVNAIRAQTFEMQRDKQDMNWVIGQDPKTGQQVMVPAGQAQQMGVVNAGKAPEDTINKALSGRHWLQLALKQGDPKGDPSEMGIMQLIDKLDSEGKLGPLASRWNDFMTEKFGSGDPEYSALHAKMGLSTTLLAQTHVGNRSGPQILEHFEDLANAGKMDGPTLKAGFKSEVNYVQDKAMDPNPPNYGKAAAKPATQEKTGPPPGATMKVPGSDGKLHWSDGKKDLGVIPDGQ